MNSTLNVLRTSFKQCPDVYHTFIKPQSLTILATYRCTASCEHCCFDSNPWIRKRISVNDILEFIEEAIGLGSVRVVVFSGGECFLLGDDLVKAIGYASDNGLMTRCVTNGYWAKSLSQGRRRLTELKNVGLTELNISTGDFHQKYVSEETVVNAACLSVEMGFKTLIVVETHQGRSVTAETLFKNTRIRGLYETTPREQFWMLESPWMPMNLESRLEYSEQLILNKSNVHLRTGCDSIFSTIVLTPDRNVGICCGLSRERIPELNLDITEDSLLKALGEAGREFVKIWLFVDGPERILAWAGSINPAINWENRYAHRCHCCLAIFDDYEVRKTIAENYKERIDDVLMRYSLALKQQDLISAQVYS